MSLISRYVLLAALCGAPLAQAHEPQMPPAVASQLAVSGAVQQPLTLNVEELRQFEPSQIVEVRLPGRDAGAAASVLKGVRLRAVLERAKLKTADHNTVKKLAIIAAASDGYKVVFSWNELFNAELGDSVIVVFERDGKPLAAAEGPLALISGKDTRTGPRHVKWLQSLEVRQIVD
jgi:DMSO/TMAO reductase YedYZ molybdopterin-dependent catalytic subunit